MENMEIGNVPRNQPLSRSLLGLEPNKDNGLRFTDLVLSWKATLLNLICISGTLRPTSAEAVKSHMLMLLDGHDCHLLPRIDPRDIMVDYVDMCVLCLP